MKPSPRRVLALWRNNPDWRASLKDVRDALGSAKAQMPKLKSLLDELVAQEKLTYHRHRYQIAPPATPAAKSKSKRKTPLQASGLTGVFSAHPDGYGFVAVEQSDQSVFIPPRKDGGALDGDKVQLVMERRRGSERTSGKIISVVGRRRSTVRGFVHIERGERWLLPLNEKLPMVFLEPESGGPSYSRGDLAEAEFATYPPDSRTAPTARLLRVLPPPDAPHQIVDNILADLQISVQFTAKTEKEMAALESSQPPQSGSHREDLTDLPFVTIDGDDARDFDDAISLIPGDKGAWRLLVAIADVAEFVRPGSAVDKEAYTRGTSVYFPELVVPMLPELLSNELCSLKPGVPRLTLVCELVLDAEGQLTDYRIFQALIRSKARLTYQQVQRFFDGEKATVLDQGESMAPMLKHMLRLSQLLAGRRGERGALAFEFPEARFLMSAPGRPESVLQALPSQATKLIEQFMLEANETVALHCESSSIPILYRVHDPPPPDQLAQLRLQLLNFGITVTDRDLAESSAINVLIARVADHPAREEIELIILKSLAQAQYRGSNDGHFGLAASHYAHFTSPIRRYPDLLVHRALKHAANSGGKSLPLPSGAGAALSICERTAGEAESRVHRLYRVLYMEKFLGQDFPATVSGISSRGLWVRPREHFVEGLLPTALLPDDQYRFDTKRGVLRAGRGKRVIAFGQRLTVQLVRAERLTQELEFGFSGWDWGDEERGKP